MVTERKITPERLTFKDFMAAFRAQYRYGYPQFYDKYSITEQMVRKNNKELHGLIIRTPGNRIAPVFYYEDFYKAYKKGTTIDECVKQIVSFVERKSVPGNDFGEKLTHWESNCDKLILKMINYKNNRNLLMNTPFRFFGDMAVIVQIYMNDPVIGKGAITVDNELMRIWSVSRSTLFDRAIENMKQYHVKMVDLMEISLVEEEYDSDAPRIFVVSYDADFHGASVMLQTDILLDFARNRDMDFYVMPVSTHEILLIERREEMENEVILEMLKSINSDERLVDNMLSEEVYRLDRQDDRIRSLYSNEEVIMADN